MNILLRASLIYLSMVLVITALLNGSFAAAFNVLTGTAIDEFQTLSGLLVKLWWAIPLAAFLLGPKRSIERIVPTLYVTASAFIVQIGFMFAKCTIPQLVPFYADEALIQMDQVILFGNHAWELVHGITPDALAAWFPTLYLPVWMFAALAFPILVVATDPDIQRATRFTWIFFGSWLVVGNVLATIGSSVGPIYIDRLTGGNAFAGLHDTLTAKGWLASPIGQVQDRLWEVSTSIDVIEISAISAFPSMHVAVATIVALYLQERSRILGVIGWSYFIMIVLISVYSGYHYIWDAIVAAAVVWGANWFWKTRADTSNVLEPVPDAAN